jgi:pyruvate-formate lyase-activating enzyme
MPTNRRQTTASDDEWLRDRFCGLPWSFAEVHRGGDVYVCCPRYSGNRPIGNIFSETPSETWNSQAARRFRQGILDGTFDMCHRTQCPRIAGRDLPARSSITDERLRAAITAGQVECQTGPRHVKLAHDDSCNLTCPSCRSHTIVAKAEQRARLQQVLDNFIVPFLSNCDTVDLSGDGDPIASTHYRDILVRLAGEAPKTKIAIQTNGALLDPRNWDRLKLAGRVTSVSVSIDAASQSTYAILRRGGSWPRLLENLAFLGSIRKDQGVSWFALLFVVQALNYREMPAFVELGRTVGADRVGFSLVHHWPRGQTAQEYAASKIWSADHPNYADFLACLGLPVFDDPIVSLGDVRPYRELALDDTPRDRADSLVGA